MRRSSGHFNPRPPRGGRPGVDGAAVEVDKISIHAPREGGDQLVNNVVLPDILFQSTPPARGATYPRLGIHTQTVISIHAPREGGDFGRHYNRHEPKPISIHAPREGGDLKAP